MPLLSENQKKLKEFDTPEERKAAIKADLKEKKIYCGKNAVWRRQIPVVFTWKCDEKDVDCFKITISEKPDFSDPIYLFAADKKTDQKKLVAGLNDTKFKIGQKYYWKVTSLKKREKISESAPSSFQTEDLVPRWIAIKASVSNIRDLGGYRTLDGKRVKQNLVFRGQGLNFNSADGENPGQNRLMVVDLDYFLKDVKIHTDLDLRTNGETANMKVSPLGESVQFIQRSSPCYGGMFSKWGKSITAKNFRVFCDLKNYPIYFHCIAGADRTGSLAFVLEAVLGVPEKEIELDYERTFYPWQRNGEFWKSYQSLKKGIMKYGKEGDTLQKRAEFYLEDCGISREEMEKFRSIMLEQ
ncbi:MAG: tyrosine-protein phosphatase [Lentisphaeria bacterium]|nr:tyrosine-protein phosphatase [Lentisphaeria bacterium]